MKSILILTTLILIFSGCSHKNAFSNFEMTQKQELGASSLQNSKVKAGERVDGIFSAIYLNEVYPELFNQNEYFYIFYYLKNEENSRVKLNGFLPLKIKKLERENQFSHLIEVQNRWTQYYLVSFDKQDNNLSLVFENGQSSSDTLIYQKDEQ
jgi:hypothetical protein